MFLSDEEGNLTPTQAKCCLLLGLYTIDIDTRVPRCALRWLFIST
jgi:hypothetical protein